jgi:GT2 family glycosyltransferase
VPGQQRKQAIGMMDVPRSPAAAGSSDPEVSVVIPHLNDEGRLALCLRALAAQTLGPERFEVLVIDNGSQEPPAALVAGFPGMRLVAEPTPGPGPARNRGVALARAPVVAFTDSDCIPDPGWLATILARFADDPGSVVLGGTVRVFAEAPDRPNVAEAFDLIYGFRQELTIARHDFSATANLAVRREVFAAVGGFAGLAVSEDMEWGRRAKLAGFPTRFVPQAVVEHPARRSMSDLRRQWDRHVSHYWSMQPKSIRGQAEWALKAAAMAASPVAEVPRILGSDRLQGPRQRLAAFRALAAMRLYRSRRMFAELAAPASRQRRARWNRS